MVYTLDKSTLRSICKLYKIKLYSRLNHGDIIEWPESCSKFPKQTENIIQEIKPKFENTDNSECSDADDDGPIAKERKKL